MNPRVSVVVTCFNLARFLEEAVESALDQTVPPDDVELLIVDDGSTDGSQELARTLAARHPDRAIRLIELENGGVSRARNRAIAEARGAYVVCLDGDDRLAPGFVEACARALDDDPAVSIAYGHQQSFGADETFEQHPFYDAHTLAHANFIGSASMFRRRAWADAGGYCEELPSYEDWDFWLSCAAAGHHGRLVPDALWHYRVREDSKYRQKGKKRDPELKARIVLRHPTLYDAAQRAWADAVLRGDPDAIARGAQLGVVPGYRRRRTAVAGTDRLHVVFTMHGWDDEGGGTMLPRQLAKRLAARGHRVSVLSTPPRERPDRRPYWVDRRFDDGVDLYEIYNRPSLFADPAHPEREVDEPAMRAVVADLLDDLGPDVVHYHSLPGFSMRLAEDVDGRGIPSVYTAHNYWPICPQLYLFRRDLSPCGSESGRCGCGDREPRYRARQDAGRTMLSRHVDRHLAVSTRVRDIFAAHGHDTGRIAVLHQQPQTVDAIWRDVGSRRAAGAHAAPPRVAFIGGVYAHKGVHVLVEALQALPPGTIECVVHGGGNPAYVDALRAADVRRAVDLAGAYAPGELPALLAAADVVVVPSVTEDCAPLVLAEAHAARLPVVGSRIGGIPDFVRDGVDGLLVPPGDAAALAAALRRLAEEPGLLARLQEGIDPPAGFDAYVDAVERHYRDVIEQRRAVAARVPGARAFAVLTRADDVIADPALVVPFLQGFSADEEATLVVDAAGADVAALERALVLAGLDDDGPDVLAIVDGRDLERRVDAVLALDADAAALRHMAEARWAAQPASA